MWRKQCHRWIYSGTTTTVTVLLLIFSIKIIISSKHLLVLKTSWRRLQHVFSVTILRLPRRLEAAFKTSHKTSWRRLGRWKIVTLKTSSRRLEDISWRRLQTSWRQTKCLLGISVSDKSIFHKSISEKSKVNPKCVT